MTRTHEHGALLSTLQRRFETHPHRHAGLRWPDVLARLRSQPVRLTSLQAMEASGGEPDVIVSADDVGDSDTIVFVDCAAESPAGRRSLCYDRAARDARKEHKPESSAVEMAAAMGVDILTPEQYRALQTLGAFDTKTSSWLATPAALRGRGGALFGDRRYDEVFVYHNGASSYYAARGFRASLGV